MILDILLFVVYLITIFFLYLRFGRWLSDLADNAGDLPLRVEIIRIIATIGTPLIVVNTVEVTAKFVAFLVLL